MLKRKHWLRVLACVSLRRVQVEAERNQARPVDVPFLTKELRLIDELRELVHDQIAKADD